MADSLFVIFYSLTTCLTWVLNNGEFPLPCQSNETKKEKIYNYENRQKLVATDVPTSHIQLKDATCFIDHNSISYKNIGTKGFLGIVILV